ncbi:MAG: (d)CMP kinase [Alphaproteobacteria bacterium]
MIIAVDGSAASGKGTLAKRLARHFDLAHLDTGSLYRALGLQLLKQGANPENIDEIQAISESQHLDLRLCDDPQIRTDEIASIASIIAPITAVRANLLKLQRDFAASPPHGKGAVLDGRDIGSVVLPDAPIKLFIDADLEVRADRRIKELLRAGQSAMFRDVLADMRVRDQRDRERDVAPLRAVSDAKIIDTSDMDADQVFAAALDHITTVTAE